MTGIECYHGAFIPSLEDDGYKDISKFMDGLIESMANDLDSEVMTFIRESVTRQSSVWNDDILHETTVGIVSAMGVNTLLRDKKEMKKRTDNANTLLASTLLILEHYKEKNDINAALYSSFAKIRDIGGGGDRESLRFFSKRITCSCLDSLYVQSKSKQRKVGQCYGCEKTFRRSTLKVCERCRISQYCSEGCQRQHWPLHKGDCGSWSKCRAWCIDYGFILE